MNKYARTAQEHWAKWLPQRLSQLPDPDSFFSSLGQQVQQRIEDLTETLAGDDPPNESYRDKLGRLNMARLTAEEQAMRELALLEPETRPTA